MRRFLVLSVTALIVSFIFTGCAYFNTFYMAKKNFSDGEVLRKRDKGKVVNQTVTKYKDAVEYSRQVIEKYKNSKYVDDALYIIGMSYFRQKNFVESKVKFDEILAAFPDSKFASDAIFYKAKCLIELDDIDEARSIFIKILNSGDNKVNALAGFEICELDILDKDWLDMKDISLNIIDLKTGKDDVYTANYYTARAEFELNNYQNCIDILKKYDREKLATDLRFRMNTLLSSAYAELGNYDIAMNYLNSIGSKGKFEIYSRQIRLELANLYEIKGDKGLALDTYKKLAGDYPDSLEGKKAWYQAGLLILQDLSKAKEAKDCFDKIKEDSIIKTEPWYVDAQIKKSQIVRIDSLLTKIDKISGKEVRTQTEKASTDSTSKPEEATKTNEKKTIDYDAIVSARFSLAEIYTFSFDRPDSALSQYRLIIEESPGSEYAVKSEYFLGLNEIKSSGKYSSETEKELMKNIVTKHPKSQFSQELKVILGEQVKTPEEMDFLNAENARMNGKKPEEYIPMYLAAAEKNSGTEMAYQALFIAAYCYEHNAGEKDKAYEILKKLSEEKPNSVNKKFVKLAQDKMEMVKKEPELLSEITKNISAFEFEIGSDGKSLTSSKSSEETVESQQSNIEESYPGLKKIRARNARIRSRYFTN